MFSGFLVGIDSVDTMAHMAYDKSVSKINEIIYYRIFGKYLHFSFIAIINYLVLFIAPISNNQYKLVKEKKKKHMNHCGFQFK